MQAVRESARRVVERSRSVWIDEGALRTGARLLAPHALALSWDRHHHFFDGTARTVQYLFILDSLNFCFWPEPRWRYRYENEWLDGYLALASSLKEAVARGASVLEASFLAQINENQLSAILAGENEVPLLRERVAVLREAGAVLQAEYDGQAVHLVEEARRSTERLVTLLAQKFSSFRDEALYRGERVCFYKRAQIFCADLYGAFGGERWGEFTDIENLT
ncbi:MAG: queuosine salvage family protein, partial [Candidatus Bipolaricaulota bacterium]|nr:queuosine salvage family protein [Candidatus Bipolaricaulota bacterium]